MNLTSKQIFLRITFIAIISCCKITVIQPIANSSQLTNCLVKSYSIHSQRLYTSAVGGGLFTYNNDGKILFNNYDGHIQSSYLEDKSNLGSDLKPYVTVLDKNGRCEKYYCDENGRVNRTEYFSSVKSKYPNTLIYEEYDNDGYHIKSSSNERNELTGEYTGNYSISEAEYIDGNLVKCYSSSKFNAVLTERHLQSEYKMSSFLVKTKINYLYNFGVNSFGNNNRFYPIKEIDYNPDGSIKTIGYYIREFDNDGYLLSSMKKYSDGTYDRYYDYKYQCE